MAFHRLQLNREKIESAISEYAEGTSFHINKISDGLSNYTISVPGEQPALLSIYYPIGGTTLSPAKGRNPTLGEKIAQHIVDICLYTQPSARTIYKRDITDEQFLEIQEYLTVNEVVFINTDNYCAWSSIYIDSKGCEQLY